MLIFAKAAPYYLIVMGTRVKICGISTLEAARTALDDSADFLGFIHFAKSPRHLTLDAMADLLLQVRALDSQARLVSVVVDPENALLEALRDQVRPDLIQLHGHETPERVAQIAQMVNIPLIKAIPVSDINDLRAAAAYEPFVDYLMFDAKPPKDAAIPGGLGLSFDWTIMRRLETSKPWFLAGGLTAENAENAIRQSGATMLDASSSLESAPGVKDTGLISSFLRAAKSL